MDIIAEIGTSHGGDLDKAKRLVDSAAEAGATGVKFQWVYADEILHPETGHVNLPGGRVRLYDRFRALEAPPGFYRKCRDHAKRAGLKFICSPFGPRSLRELVETEPDAIKIASPEVSHIPLLEECARYFRRVPLILSGGVSKLGDIERAVDTLTGAEGAGEKSGLAEGSAPLTLLHCVTYYPAPPEEYNVRCVETLERTFGLPAGISDHSMEPVLIPVLATAFGAKMIEKHITLSRDTDGLDDPVALEPGQFAQMAQAVRQTQAVLERHRKASMAQGKILCAEYAEGLVLTMGQKDALDQMSGQFGKDKVMAAVGDGVKRLAPCERLNYGRTNRSLHYTRGLPAGHRLTHDDVAVLRTEKTLTPGISPAFLNDTVGAVLQQDVSDGEGVLLSHITAR